MTAAQPSATTAQDPLRAEDVGYHKSLRPRQLQMIGIGGAIGTGLFLGARSRLAGAGPGLFLVYAVCGVFVFFILQALGELVLYHPSSGSSVSYAREFYEKKLAVVVGWMFFFHWSTTAIADITAIASYVQYWRAFRSLPQWLFALIALVAVVGINLISVRWFGELEFWAALIKVVALVTFLIVGTIFLACRFEIYGQSACPSVIADHGGLFPIGVLPLVLVTTGVVFAYAGVELAGIAARRGGEPGQDHVARDQLCDRPDRGVLRRLTCSARTAAAALHRVPCGESPFVKLGIGGAASILNLVVLTAAFSSLNGGLYSTGRILRSMSMNGSAPAIGSRMSSRGVPYIGILATAAVALIGVGLNGVAPDKAWD